MHDPKPNHHDVSTKDVLRKLASRKWSYLIFLVVFFSSSVLLIRYNILQYTSSTTIMVIDGFKAETRSATQGLPDFLLPSDQFNRVLQVVNSNQMFDHLIRKFHLYQHYGIDSTSEFRDEQAISILRSRLDVKKTPYNTAVISVSDPYRYFAYEIANEMALYADTLNRKLLVKLQQKRVQVYERIYRQLNQSVTEKQVSLEKLIQRLPTGRSNELHTAESDLTHAVVSMTNAIDNFNHDLKEQMLILESLNQENFPTVIQQQRALPASKSLLLPSLLYGLLLTAMAATLVIVYHHFRLRYHDHFSIFGNNYE